MKVRKKILDIDQKVIEHVHEEIFSFNSPRVPRINRLEASMRRLIDFFRHLSNLNHMCKGKQGQ